MTAVDDFGNTQSKEIAITQVSLDEIVVTEVKTEPLSVEEIEQLVDDGVIELDDPANYNVSTFNIVLAIEKEPIPISVPIVFPKGDSDNSGFETYKMPKGGGDGGSKPKIPDVQIIVFQQPVSSPSSSVDIPPIPGVIVIEGNIKSLKEFFSVRFMMMNTSGIFTLSDVVAEIEFPDGGLTSILPADGLVSFGDILPGTPDQPGQMEKRVYHPWG